MTFECGPSFLSKLLFGNLKWISLLLLMCSPVHSKASPHIIFIFVDDLGWNDVSFHGASDIPTPNIDALGLNGIILNSYYGEWLCTPSRGALLTGLYPMRLGLQRLIITPGERSALPIELTTLPQYLKLLGYKTHMVGKWHLGYQNKMYMPTNRGFDSFFGNLNGQLDYFDYTYADNTLLPSKPVYFGRDLYNGTTPVPDYNGHRGKYATNFFTEQAVNVIRNHDISKPLFLYLAQIAIHVSNNIKKMQAPPEVISKFTYIKDMNRRIHAAKLWVLDETIGVLFSALHRKSMLQNCLFVLVSDNGGMTYRLASGYSSNHPLRGGKLSYWEGGVRIPALIWSPLLNLTKPRVSRQLMHVTDWMPTLYSAAGGNTEDLGHIDGQDMWEVFRQNLPSPRTEVLNAMDPIDALSALRLGSFKVVNGTTSILRDYLRFTDTGRWFGPTGSEHIGKPDSFYEWIFRNGSLVRDILVREGWWIAGQPDKVYEAAVVSCKDPPPVVSDCKPTKAPCLYNIDEDPCEYHNLASEYPDIVNLLMSRIHDLAKQQMYPQAKPSDPSADPVCHNFTFVPWLDPEHFTKCDYDS